MRLHERAALGGVASMLAALLVASAAACSPGSGPGGLSVVVGFYPLQFVAERVGGDQVRVANLAQPGAEPHDLELSPRQVGQISDASLVVYLSGFQPAVDEAVGQSAVAALDVASVVHLRDATDLPADEGLGGRDPHVWLDPTLLATIASAVAARLEQLDPDGAAGYRDRATALTGALSTVDQEYRDGLRQCGRREIVVSHAAFGYLADRYGLRQIPITGLSPDTEPTPGQLASAVDQARRAGATTIFVEPLVSADIARSVADAAGARVAVLDPIEGLQGGSSADYVSVMRANLDTLRTALGCS